MGKSPQVTELEGVILGIVHSRGSCTGYAVRQRFARSPTYGWSASQGAIYPAVQRLVSKGLLTTEPNSLGARRAGQLSLSSKGLAALRDWMLAVSPEMGSAPVDPIRARVNYLESLTPKQRSAFLERAIVITEAALDRSRESQPDPDARGGWAMEAALLGSRLQLKAKLEWLIEVRALEVK